ncbi:MAG: efflux RND transporter periplasmic adaptor subunit [Acidobacteria bacterium]|nr:efflux RND transporter periplasmic adaptor subunit [Acidobacteriota bacterium]
MEMAEEPNSGNRAGGIEWRGYAQLGAIVFLIAVALFFARAPGRVERGAASGPAAESVRPTVPVVHPSPTEQALTVELTGTVNLEERVRVASEVVGRIAWVSPDFSNGGSIRANEPFIRIDPAEFELQVEAAEMAVREADAQVWVERAGAEEDIRAFERENPGVEPSEAIRRLPSIAEAEARLMRAQADLKLAELRLERTNISLPYDGRVTASDVEVGELVGPADRVDRPASRLGIVYRTEALQVAVPIEPRDLEYLDPVIDRSARVAGEMATWEARVARVSSVVAPRTRLASVFLKFAEDAHPDSLPAPGTFVEVAIAGPVYEDVYVLPESVVQERDSVWVVRDGLLSAFAPETVGRTAAGWVVQAFDAGEGLVVGVLPGAREGLAVEVTAAPSSN